MTLTLELPKELEASLQAQADSRSLTLSQFVLSKLDDQQGPATDESFSEFIMRATAEARKGVPQDVLHSIPPDLSVNHDHYLYGAPKVER